MIKITMTVEQANRINRLAKKYLDKKNFRASHRHMRLTVEGETLTVEGLDGFKYFKYKAKIDNISNKDGVLYVPELGGNFKKADSTVLIEEFEKEIRVAGLKDNDIRIFPKIEDMEYFNIKDDFLKENETPEFEISIDAKKLKDALDGFDSDIVTLNFYGEFKPLIMDNEKDIRAMLMPFRRRGAK